MKKDSLLKVLFSIVQVTLQVQNNRNIGSRFSLFCLSWGLVIVKVQGLATLCIRTGGSIVLVWKNVKTFCWLISNFKVYSVLLSFIQPKGDFNLYFKLQHYLNWQMALFWVCELIPKDRQHNIVHGQLIMQGGRLLKNVHNHSFLRHWLIILGNINI